jgi:hypothetical protein
MCSQRTDHGIVNYVHKGYFGQLVRGPHSYVLCFTRYNYEIMDIWLIVLDKQQCTLQANMRFACTRKIKNPNYGQMEDMSEALRKIVEETISIPIMMRSSFSYSSS